MPHVPHLWDLYDEALEGCSQGDDSRLRALARAGATLVANGQLTEAGVLSDARDAGLTAGHLADLQHHLDDLL